MPQQIIQRADDACLIHPADAEPLLVPDDSQMSDPVLAAVIAHLRQRGYIVIDPWRVRIAHWVNRPIEDILFGEVQSDDEQ